MSTSKRRKLNTDGSPQPMSAFALRKKLLAQQSQVPPTPVDEANATGADNSTDTDRAVSSQQKKARKARLTRHPPVKTEEASGQSSDLPRGQSRDQGSVEVSVPGPSRVQLIRRSLSPFSLEEEEEDYLENGPAQPVNLSSFRPSKDKFRKITRGLIQLKLDEGERLVILGSYGVRVESGEATIYGATLKPSQSVFWVHAPQSHALPVIRCTSNATLELRSHPSALELEGLGFMSPLFRKLWCEGSSSASNDERLGSSDTFRILYTSEDGPKKAVLQDLKAPPEWNRKTATLISSNDSTPPSIMVTGPKSSGKSTFGKILTNRLLTSTRAHTKRASDGVVILDLDPGQPEYCGPGQIALVLITKPVLSPSFCRPLDIPGVYTIRSHALASLSPASDPVLYNEMALDLMTHYRNAFRSYPLVINTPGWIQGTGLDLLVSLIGELRPSEVIYMSQSGPADAVEALQVACSTTPFSTLPSQPNQYNLRNAADLRSMHTMAYFHTQPITQYDDTDHLHWVQTPLTAVAPWQVRFRGEKCSIFGVLCYDFQTQADLVADAINGTVLAAVEVENSSAFRDIEAHQPSPKSVGDDGATECAMNIDTGEASQLDPPSLSLLKQSITTLTPEGIPFIDTTHGLTLDPRYSRSLGLVLVRGIDVKNGDFHLLSPISTSQIEDVIARRGQIVLVSGKFDPPSWAYTEDLYFQSKGQTGDGNEGVDPDSQIEGIDDLGDSREDDIVTSQSSTGPIPWIEILTRNQKRGAGSKVWRVRRDLGR